MLGQLGHATTTGATGTAVGVPATEIGLGDFKTDTDAGQLVYEMYGLILALHHDARFLRMPGSVERARIGFERLIENYRTPLKKQAS